MASPPMLSSKLLTNSSKNKRQPAHTLGTSIFPVKVAKIWFLMLVLSNCFVSGCRKPSSETIENWPGGLITKPGTYKLAGGKQVVTVWIDKEDLVRYSISEGGRAIFNSAERPSAYSTWFLYFDSNARLWFQSGDIGTFVAAKNDVGTYSQTGIVDQAELIHAMPQPFFQQLSELTQKQLLKHRRSDMRTSTNNPLPPSLP